MKLNSFETMNMYNLNQTLHIGCINAEDYLEGFLNMVKNLYIPEITNNKNVFQMSNNVRKEFIS